MMVSGLMKLVATNPCGGHAHAFHEAPEWFFAGCQLLTSSLQLPYNFTFLDYMIM